jgi:hypothetical protein
MACFHLTVRAVADMNDGRQYSAARHAVCSVAFPQWRARFILFGGQWFFLTVRAIMLHDIGTVKILGGISVGPGNPAPKK